MKRSLSVFLAIIQLFLLSACKSAEFEVVSSEISSETSSIETAIQREKRECMEKHTSMVEAINSGEVVSVKVVSHYFRRKDVEATTYDKELISRWVDWFSCFEMDTIEAEYYTNVETTTITFDLGDNTEELTVSFRNKSLVVYKGIQMVWGIANNYTDEDENERIELMTEMGIPALEDREYEEQFQPDENSNSQTVSVT